MNLKMRRANTAIQCRSALDCVVSRDLPSPMKAHTRKNAISGRGVRERTKGGGMGKGEVKSKAKKLPGARPKAVFPERAEALGPRPEPQSPASGGPPPN